MNVLRGMERHLTALYESYERGRLLGERAPSAGPAPRFHLARTRLGNLWRLRRDLEPEIAIRLATLAGKEAPLDARGAPPEREEFLRRTLEQSAPIELQWAGPAFGLPDVLATLPASGAALRELTVDDVARVHRELGLEAAELARGGCIGAEVSREIVSVCQCVRGDGSGPTEAGVRTASDSRGRGYGGAVVRAWCDWVAARGGEPLYSTSWDNAASRALAARLGLVLLGEDKYWR